MRAALIGILTIICMEGFSQSFYALRRDRSLVASIGTGTSTYFGDLQNKGDYLDAKPSANIGLMYYFTPRISARAELNWFSLSGSDAKEANPDRVKRNLSFTSSNFDLNVTGQFSLFPNGRRFYQRPAANFYGLVGVGVAYINPKAELDGKKYALQPLQTEGVKYSRIQPIVIYGIGARFKVGPFVNIAIEGAWRKMFTDYLDDVSSVYKDQSTFTDPIAAALADRSLNGPRPAGAIRGNPDRDDSYMLLNVKFEYYLPNNFLFGNKTSYNKKRKTFKYKGYRRPKRAR